MIYYAFMTLCYPYPFSRPQEYSVILTWFRPISQQNDADVMIYFTAVEEDIVLEYQIVFHYYSVSLYSNRRKLWKPQALRPL